jgi:hypothetical protein
MELENALRYQKATVPGCSCRKADQSWGQALKPAEDMLGGSDTVIDAEKAARMSRPPSPADTKKPMGTRAGPAPASGASPSISTSPTPAVAASGNHGAPAGQSSPSPGEPPRKVRIILPPPTQQAPQAQPTQPAQSAQP